MRTEIEDFFAAAPANDLDTFVDIDKSHGRIEQRSVTVAREVEWFNGERHFPGELRLPASYTTLRDTTAVVHTINRVKNSRSYMMGRHSRESGNPGIRNSTPQAA